MRRVNYLPNLLSSVRIALAPAMLGAAYSNAKTGFAVLLAIAMATDVLDGFLARQWRVESEIGRKLDHWGDMLTVSLGAMGVYFLWPQVIEAEWQWALAAFAGYALSGLRRIVQAEDKRERPNVFLKVGCWLVPAALISLIAGWTPWPFRAAALIQLAFGSVRLLAARTTPAEKAAAVEPSGTKG
jgi:CDP-diacylglycerol--glycerol-3-phosphate 3-phosphatidyltransferase